METTLKKPLFDTESQEIIRQHIGRLFRKIGENKDLQMTYNALYKNDVGVYYCTIRKMYNRKYTSKNSIEKVLKYFGLEYDFDVWQLDGVFKIVQNEN